MLGEIKDLLDQESSAISQIPVTESFLKATNLLHHRVHELKGKLICRGMGKAGQSAVNIATTFSSTGTPAVFLHPSDAQHGDLGVIQENDVLLLISNSGETREIIELIRLVGDLFPDIPLIVISGSTDSELAGKADVLLYTGNPKEVCPLGLTPTTSTTSMTVIGDVLVVLLMKKIGFTASDYSRRHHGGYLGDKSRNTK